MSCDIFGNSQRDEIVRGGYKASNVNLRDRRRSGIGSRLGVLEWMKAWPTMKVWAGNQP